VCVLMCEDLMFMNAVWIPKFVIILNFYKQLPIECCMHSYFQEGFDVIPCSFLSYFSRSATRELYYVAKRVERCSLTGLIKCNKLNAHTHMCEFSCIKLYFITINLTRFCIQRLHVHSSYVCIIEWLVHIATN